jgi:hypothetical protein
VSDKTDERKKARSGKKNKFFLGGTYTVFIELDDIDAAIHDDEATLESTDDAYKKTVKVAEVGKIINDEFLRITFTGVIPGKKYSFIYDLKKDLEGNELGTITMFYDLVIDYDNMDGLTNRKEFQAQDEEEKDEISNLEHMAYDSESADLYEEPDPEADEEAILVEEEEKDLGKEV